MTHRLPDADDSHPGRMRKPKRGVMKYEFTPQHIEMYKKWNTESYYQRAFPLALGFGAVTFLCLKPRIPGSKSPPSRIFISAAMAAFGFGFGKLIYMPVLRERFDHLHEISDVHDSFRDPPFGQFRALYQMSQEAKKKKPD